MNSSVRPNRSVVQFAAAELAPDFIGKRVLEAMDVPREDVARVAPTLNAAGIYARAFSYLGWAGAATMFAALAVVVVCFTWLIGGTRYAVPAIATLNTLVLLCVFENMLSFTGMVMQLFWLLVFAQCFPRSPTVETGRDSEHDTPRPSDSTHHEGRTGQQNDDTASNPHPSL